MDWHERIGRRLKLRDLHTFSAVVRHGTMAKAAAELALTPPAVSKALQEMERVLGVRLMDRTATGVLPTPYGELLLQRSVGLFDDLRQTVKEIRFLADPTVGELAIASTDPLLGGLVPAVIDRLTQKYPRLSFRVVQVESGAQAIRLIRTREVDICVSRIVDHADDLVMETLFEDPVVLVAAAHHALARRRNVALREVAGEAWSVPATLVGRFLRDVFRRQGLDFPKTCLVCNSIAMQIVLVETGRFVMILPASFLHFRGKRFPLKVLPLSFDVSPPPVGFFTLKNRTISPVAKLFIEDLRSVAKSMPAKR